MAIDYTRLRKKLNPESQVGGDPGLQLRTGTVTAIDGTTGATTITIGSASVVAPVLGGAVFAVGTVVQVLSYRGSLLILGGSDDVSAQPVQLTGTGASSAGTTSTSFTNNLTTGADTGIHGVKFVAPPSGKVWVEGRVVGGNSTVGAYTLLDFEVRAGSTIGSGTVFRASDNGTAGAHQSATASSQGSIKTGALVTGLTPGTVYNVALTYSVTAGATSINRKNIHVLPM